MWCGVELGSEQLSDRGFMRDGECYHPPPTHLLSSAPEYLLASLTILSLNGFLSPAVD